jgi:hypothetical protein
LLLCLKIYIYNCKCSYGQSNLNISDIDYLNYLVSSVGNGLHISFWYDKWCGDSALKCFFLEFFALARNKEALVSEYMDHFSPHTLCFFLEFFALARNKEALVSEYMDHFSPHTL